ncbi:DUF6069 family protein [Micromonospora sp. NPDC020750]|uniref:DUF6069 family protein n=1 Tax=unclassified Micromonospora TaxID=2617518 RepID=UPI0037B514AE
MITDTTGRPAPTPSCAAARRRARALAVLAATGATHAVWYAATGPAGIDVEVRSGTGPQPVGPGAVAAATLLAGLAGWALLALLERRTRRARGLWTAVAVAVLLLSLAGPVTEGVGTAATVTLLALHLAAGAVLIPVLGRGGTRRP